jgi:steroid 5-alpha reductase family enzyme
MTGLTFALLGVNLAILIAAMIVLWILAVRIRDVSFIDAFWGFGMVLMALASWLHAGPPTPRGSMLLVLTAMWGLRLSLHLFIRWRANGEDARYKRIISGVMEAKGWSWPKTALIMVFAMQAPLLFITCLPAQVGIIASHNSPQIGILTWIGAIVALYGIMFETIGDMQLKAFKANQDNNNKVLDTGLWRYTRHPNYFGDFAAWWGIWIVAADASWVVAATTIIGPLFLSFTLMKWSGGPLLERGMKKTRLGYQKYVARTSAFFPWPPKKD